MDRGSRTRAVQTPRSLSASPAPAGWQHRFAGGYWGRSPQNAGIFIGWYCLVSILSNGASSPPGSPPTADFPLRGRKTGMEDPSRNRPSGELARTPGLPRPSATRQESTAKSSPTIIDLDAVKLFLHKRMTEMEVVSHSTQTAKFLLEATLVEHHSSYPVGLGVRSFGMLFPCWTGRGRSL